MITKRIILIIQRLTYEEEDEDDDEVLVGEKKTKNTHCQPDASFTQPC